MKYIYITVLSGLFNIWGVSSMFKPGNAAAEGHSQAKLQGSGVGLIACEKIEQ
jgi:hypothetical protein